jgi:uncharacterized coiled-coil protein SlyX
MNKSNNLILNAVLSKLQSEKAEVLVKIDLIVNKNNISNVNSVIDDTTNLFKELNNLEGTLELVDVVIEQNNAVGQSKEKLEEINDMISKLNESQPKEENNGNNS